MNAKAVESPTPTPAPGPERGSLAYLVGAVGLVVIVAVLVLVFGVVHPPELPSLDSAGVTPPTSVAWTQWDDRDDCTALAVARPNGSVDRLACEQDVGDAIAWTSQGIVTLGWAQSGPVLFTWNATTGEVVRREAAADDYAPSFASSVSSFHRDGALVVTLDPGGREVWTVDAPSGYDVRAGALSPDGEWVVMTDSADRLLVVRVSGGSPAVWTEDANTSWMGPVWEGAALPDSEGDPK